MALSEFDLIAKYFAACGAPRADVLLGVGDDCALLHPPPKSLLALTTDTLVAGVHFAPGVDPESLGHKSLAVNLSDLAAMGAEPAWATLALTLPQADESWLEAFSRGLCQLAKTHGVRLIGGDTTRGPMSITIQAAGFVSPERVMRRSGAQPGDLIYVTGTLGDAGLALLARRGRHLPMALLPGIRRRLDWPTPRIAAGKALAGIASAAIDISDGLVGDLGHILEASGVGASLFLDLLPLGEAVADYVAATDDWSLPLAAGDDYELCLTLSADHQEQVEAIAQTLDCRLTWVGLIERAKGLRCVLPDGKRFDRLPNSYDHFRAGS